MSVSVVIPTLNEAGTIGECLERLKAQGAVEVVVADAGSPDGTAAIAREAGAKVVSCGRGRGVQQNSGARVSVGRVLVFLHADCWLEDGAIVRLERFLGRNPKVPGGCFRMRVEATGPAFRLIDSAAHLRAGVLGVPYGDQAMFVRREEFEAAGGFPEVPLMDDVLLALRLRKRGRLAVMPDRVHVSARRWRRQGLARQTVRNWALTAMAAAGVRPETLARYYPVVR